MIIGILSHYEHQADSSIDQIKQVCLNKNIEVKIINPLDINLAIGFTPNVPWGYPKVDSIITRCDIDDISTAEAEAYFKAIVYYKTLGVPISNDEQAVRISQNKILTHQMLMLHHIPTPKSFFSHSLDNLIETAQLYLGYPLIGKTIYGGRGENVVKINNEEELVSFYDKCYAKNELVFIQEFINTNLTSTGACKSYRTIVGRDANNAPVVFASYEKQSIFPDFRTSMLCGATASTLQKVDEEILEFSRKTLDALKADLTAIDLLKDNEGNIYVLESNICFYCIDAMTDFIGVNIWERIVNSLFEKQTQTLDMVSFSEAVVL